jgi:hypothetical protein
MFELRVTLPVDERCAALVRDLAAQGARFTGCSEGQAAAFGRSAETAVDDVLAHTRAGSLVSVVLQQSNGPMEMVITAEGTTKRLEI